jgi:hypothetical protein
MKKPAVAGFFIAAGTPVQAFAFTFKRHACSSGSV